MVRHTNHDMEATFYEDQYSVNNQMENMKGRLHIELHDARQLGKQFTRHLNPILSSPDVNKLGLTTPDFEKFLFQNGNLVSTPTPGLFPIGHITAEQEQFGEGFDKALQELKHGDNSGIMYDLDGSHGYSTAVIKEEPQTVPSASTSPAMSPVDMESQERMKLERKRLRNREAASKCRRRKLERISKLEDKVKSLKIENSDLATKVHKLKAHVFKLKEQVIEHVNSGCAIDQPYC